MNSATAPSLPLEEMSPREIVKNPVALREHYEGMIPEFASRNTNHNRKSVPEGQSRDFYFGIIVAANAILNGLELGLPRETVANVALRLLTESSRKYLDLKG